ncbi:hypothetical protein BYT27DRAFT_7339807 [Phlegmacium glaucopus]|nr:hypothetical protein BYT27DRAFT_7339807 [Phlegmacium glaucopus]
MVHLHVRRGPSLAYITTSLSTSIFRNFRFPTPLIIRHNNNGVSRVRSYETPEKAPRFHLEEDIILIGRTLERVRVILAASNEIAEVAATEQNHAAEPLRRVSELSESLWTEIKSHRVEVFPSEPIYNCLEAYSSILFDIHAKARSKELTSSNAHDLVQQIEVSFHNFKKTLDCVGSMSNSHLFPYVHDFVISGGQFEIVNNSVDIKGHEKILEMHRDVRHIKVVIIILFGSAGHR